jgi:hypothetical protein
MHIPATSVSARDVHTLIEYSPTLLDDHRRPVRTVQRFPSALDVRRAIEARRAEAAYAAVAGLQAVEPVTFERSISHVVIVPHALGVDRACLPRGFRHDHQLEASRVTTDEMRRRIRSLAESAEQMAARWQSRAARHARLKTEAREIGDLARQLLRTAEMMGADLPTTQPSPAQHALF